MRSRPKVKLLLSPGVVSAGQRLTTETVLSSTSKTPVEFVSVRLSGVLRGVIGAGRSQSVFEHRLFERESRSKPFELGPGEHKLPAVFELPPDAAPSYRGTSAVAWTLAVHVAIPWWPDRRSTFVLPVIIAPGPAPDPRPMTFVTPTDGPRGKAPFIELSLDTTQIALGEVVSGSISLQNLAGRSVRGVDVSFVEMETVVVPRHEFREARRFTIRVYDGTPAEGAAITFKTRLPEAATPSFVVGAAAPVFHVRTLVEVRAEVAWGQDIVVRAPVIIAPRTTAPRTTPGWVAPVGHERQMLVWRAAAEKLGLTADLDEQKMIGQRGTTTISIGTDHRDDDYWMVAKLGWPSLGLDLNVARRSWTDVLGLDILRTGDATIDRRLRVHAREHAQSAAVATPLALATVMFFDEVAIDDDGASLATRDAPHVAAKLEAFIGAVLSVADAFTDAATRIGPPSIFGDDVPAWEATAVELRGRLELGRMWIRGHVGTSAVEIGSVWSRSGEHLGTLVKVAIDPVLETVPVNVEDPALSPAARAAWKELASRARTVTIDPAAIRVELDGKLSDPRTVLPILDLAVTLRRALGGPVAAGPFR